MSSRATEGKPVMSHTSGTLMYWNTHSGFGEIELDNEDHHVAVYRADLLRAGVRAPQIGDRFHPIFARLRGVLSRHFRIPGAFEANPPPSRHKLLQKSICFHIS